MGAFYMFRGSALPQPGGNSYPALMFMSQSRSHPVPIDNLPPQWKSRLAICFLTAKWLDWAAPQTNDQFLNTFAAFPATFVFCLFVLMIFTLDHPALPMLGVMAGLVCNAMPDLHPYLLPWDMPAMFFFTAAFLAYRKKCWAILALVVLPGAVIKETVLLGAFFFLAAPWKWWVRIGTILALAAASQIIVKSFTPAGASLSWAVHLGKFWDNLYPTTLLKLWPDIFANAGGLILLFWCLIRKRDWVLSLVVVLFVLGLKYTEIGSGLYMPGRPPYTEFRDWSELLPLCWIMISEILLSPAPAKAEFAAGQVRLPDKNRLVARK
ncbi:MAG TPA: hypothetical protein VGJ73_11660 [Verrucomicrobiae bacterium]